MLLLKVIKHTRMYPMKLTKGVAHYGIDLQTFA
jgi:hypothetical protein